MALFESFERRIEQITPVLEKYGMKSLEEAREVCEAAGVDVYKLVKEIQPICLRMLAGLIFSVQPSPSKRVRKKLPMLQPL